VAGFVISAGESSSFAVTELQAVDPVFEAYVQLFRFGIVVLLMLTRTGVI
jgi:hypothetical protein